MERVNRSILTFDELLAKKDDYKNIFNNYTMDYLTSLLNLEVSAFRVNKDLSNHDRKVLTELRFFRNLVAYNIYHRIKKLYDNNIANYQFENLFDGYSLGYEIGINELLELLSVRVDIDGNSHVEMFYPTDKTFVDLVDIRTHRIQELEHKCSFSLGKDDLLPEEVRQWEMLDKLRKLSDDEIQMILEQLNSNNSRQRSFTNLVLNDFGLNIDKDFKNDKDGLKLDENIVAPILIKRKDKRRIFK
jgi:hypothetical protein